MQPEPLSPNPQPVTLSPEELATIPPELRAKLHLVPEAVPTQAGPIASELPPEVLAQIRAVAGAQTSGAEPGGFSWAALVYGPVYYAAMKDWPFMIFSALASVFVYTIPLLIPLAFFARRRAWHKKTWESEEAFMKTQKQWDKTGIIAGAFSLTLLYFVSQYVYTTFTSTFGTEDPSEILKQVQSQYQE